MQKRRQQDDRHINSPTAYRGNARFGRRRRIRLRLFVALLVALIGLTGFLIVLAIAVTGN